MKKTTTRSEKNTLTILDLKRWLRNTFYWSIPSVIVFLGAIGNGVPLRQALLLAIPPICTSLMDLYRKHQQEFEYTNQ